MLDSLIKIVVHSSLNMMKVGLNIEQVPNLLLVFLFNITLDSIKRSWRRVPKMKTMRRRLAKSRKYS